MTIFFKTDKLRELCNDTSAAAKVWSERRAKLLAKRLQAISAAVVLEDLRNTPGHLHELKGDRKGQLAFNLDGGNRLILEPADDPIPTKDDGGLDWTNIKALRVVEVEDYHG